MTPWLVPAAWFAAFAVLVAAGGFFSGLGAALMAVNRFRLRQGFQENGDQKVRRVVALFDDAHRVLATSLIGGTLAGVAAVAALMLGLCATASPKGQPIDWETAATTLLIGFPILLILGELAPRRFFRERADRIIFRLYHPIRWSLTVLWPFAALGIWLAQCVFRWHGTRQLPPGLLARSEPWQPLLGSDEPIAAGSAPPEGSEQQMIHGVFDLQNTRVREIMRPLIDLVAVRLPARVGDVRELACRTGYSRFPVYSDRVTNLNGYLDIYDILAASPPDDQPADGHVRQPLYVPETKRLDDLLQEMLGGHHKVAIVVDEFGGCCGWVTREDLLEEIVGEIEDEFDTGDEAIRPLDKNTFVVSGAIDIGDLNERLGLCLPSDEYDTLAGFIYDKLGRIPAVGDAVEDNNVRFEVKEMDGRRIASVQITLPTPTAPAES